MDSKPAFNFTIITEQKLTPFDFFVFSCFVPFVLVTSVESAEHMFGASYWCPDASWLLWVVVDEQVSAVVIAGCFKSLFTFAGGVVIVESLFGFLPSNWYSINLLIGELLNL